MVVCETILSSRQWNWHLEAKPRSTWDKHALAMIVIMMRKRARMKALSTPKKSKLAPKCNLKMLEQVAYILCEPIGGSTCSLIFLWLFTGVFFYLIWDLVQYDLCTRSDHWLEMPLEFFPDDHLVPVLANCHWLANMAFGVFLYRWPPGHCLGSGCQWLPGVTRCDQVWMLPEGILAAGACHTLDSSALITVKKDKQTNTQTHNYTKEP